MATRVRAVFARGGTSKALIFHAADLPVERSRRDAIFLAAMGSPDVYGRQLDGLGGGVSSLSKVCIVGPPSRVDADLDYTFAQVQIGEALVDYGGNCGNMSAAIGPFGVDEGLVQCSRDGVAVVRIHNTNTGRIIRSSFVVADGCSVEVGELEIPGVAGRGAPVRLDFLDPGGASTGRLLPTGRVRDQLDVAGLGRIEVSLVDAANACIFIAAAGLGLHGAELPAELAAQPALLSKLEAIRRAGAVAMGLAATVDQAARRRFIPLLAIVSAPIQGSTPAGPTTAGAPADLQLRMISNGQPHQALPLTGALCTAVAAQIVGSVVHAAARPIASASLRIAMPSGVLVVDAGVEWRDQQWHALQGSFFRTTRRLFEGSVLVAAGLAEPVACPIAHP